MTHVEPSPQRSRPAQGGSFRNAWTLFRVRGVPVRIDGSWLFIAAIVVFFFYQSISASLPRESVGVQVALAALGALLFFASILAHELGHMWTSLDRGIPVLSITLFALGGVTESTREAARPRDEFVIVGIGPFISLVLGAAFGLVATAVQGIVPLAVVAGSLAWMNVILAIFNIVPGYPLDGGRLLRSVLWAISKDPFAATRWAARVGQAFALTLIATGVTGFLVGGFPGVKGALGVVLSFIDGPWAALIGFFLLRGATESYRRAHLRQRLSRHSVRDVMGTVPPVLPSTLNLHQALEHIQQRPSLLWPVGDPLQGVVMLEDIDAVGSDEWMTTSLADVARPPSGATMEVDGSLDDAVAMMPDAPHNMVIVTEAGRPVGLLTPSVVSDLGS